MSAPHRKELIEVGYFLSRLGIQEPPPQLNARTWKEAYSKFYGTFGSSTTVDEFYNILKNLRDHFDGYLDNTRTGWMENGSPQQLSPLNQEVFDELQKLSDAELWERLRFYSINSYDEKLAKEKNERVKVSQANFFSSEFSGEKLLSKRGSVVIDVKHGFVVDALKNFLEKANPSAFLYNTQKIDLAYEENGILQRIYEVKTSLDTTSIYTAVGQLFMHTAGANQVSKFIVLPGPVESKELIDCLTMLNIEILWFTVQDNSCKFQPHS
ncbi:hypothetical protein V0288_00165 [Pannus brasiliensis CCIBt3594]|uniref:Restriction endonuclease n=1 Tax=Pannus brasiliensis CCIBt3594 TaxID=1427578 RepID=A0AAW9QK78_9CHRO